MREQPTADNVFRRELNYLTLPEVREFVLHVFGEMCPQYFWYIRASQRGHHHPVCRAYGGLVHHIKLAVRFANAFSEMSLHALKEMTYNQLIAAVLLHDILKRGETKNDLDTFGSHKLASACHGRYAARKIQEHIFGDEFVPLEYQTILKAVELHMGRWTGNLTTEEESLLENDYVVRHTHLADYAASRSLHKWIGERYTDESMRYLK